MVDINLLIHQFLSSKFDTSKIHYVKTLEVIQTVNLERDNSIN